MPAHPDRKRLMHVDKRWWFVVLLLVLVGLFFAFDLGHYLNLATIKSRQADLEAWRAGQPVLAAVLFFAAYVAVAALSLPGAAVMTLAAGALFGLGWGLLIVSFASSIGATLAMPQVAAVARLARKLGIPVSRPAIAPADLAD